MCFADNAVTRRFSSRDRVGTAQPWGYDKENPMEQSHVSALQLKHAGLERQLADEQNRPLPDIAIVQQLKKQKLRIKEELEHI
jgi:hypothetical protein